MKYNDIIEVSSFEEFNNDSLVRQNLLASLRKVLYFFNQGKPYGARVFLEQTLAAYEEAEENYWKD